MTSWRAIAAVTVDLPLWREQRRRVRSALDLRSRTCHGSGGIPARSMIAAGSRRSSRFLASISEPLHGFRDGKLGFRKILEHGFDGCRDDGPFLRVNNADRARVLDFRRLRPAGFALTFSS